MSIEGSSPHQVSVRMRAFFKEELALARIRCEEIEEERDKLRQHVTELSLARDKLEDIAQANKLDAIRYQQQLEAFKDEAAAIPQLRPKVLAFASMMEWILKNNDDKGGWQNCEPTWLISRLRDEVSELEQALYNNISRGVINKSEIRNETADVANFAMMIADRCGALPTSIPAGADLLRELEALREVARLAESLVNDFPSSFDDLQEALDQLK